MDNQKMDSYKIEKFENLFPNTQWCASCMNINEPVKKCGNCKLVSYCSKSCQKKHWKKSHSILCMNCEETSNIISNVDVFTKTIMYYLCSYKFYKSKHYPDIIFPKPSIFDDDCKYWLLEINEIYYEMKRKTRKEYEDFCSEFNLSSKDEDSFGKCFFNPDIYVVHFDF